MRLWSLNLGLALAACVAACSSNEDPGDPAASGGIGASGGAQGGKSATTGGSPAATSGGSAQGGTPAASGNGGKGGATGGSASTTGGIAQGTGGVAQGTGGAAGVTGGTGSITGGASNGGLAGGGAGGAIVSGPPAVRFVGRMDTSDAAGPKFAWSGSGIIARFRGTEASAKFAGGQEYTVVLNGDVKSKFIPTSGMAPVVSNLPDGEYTLELYRRTEAGEGVSQFLGFDFGSGELLPPPAPLPRRIEIIGDSITCGYGNEGANMDCGFTPQTENHYLTYGAIAARALGAELVTVAWSGKGVICNFGDAADSCNNNPMPVYYDRTLPNDAASKWDHSRYEPDAIVVNLGTNDFSTDSDPSQQDFQGAYEQFVTNIRSKHPNAKILLTNGSMLSGEDLTKARGYIENVVTSFKGKGDDDISSFQIEPQNSADGYGCDWHPSLATHRKMAAALEAALKAALGW
jgi:lysophospholipase L1-like esterase